MTSYARTRESPLLAGLKRKRAELAGERDTLKKRIQGLELALGHLDATIRLLYADFDPAVIRPKKPAAALRGWLPRGEVAAGCLRVLKAAQKPLSTPEVVAELKAAHGLTFKKRSDEEDFASSVAMALGRFARRTLVRETGKVAKTGAKLWELAR